jgi:hypothetical protein
MPKVKVIQAYADTRDVHQVGEVLDVDDRTATELIATGLAERDEPEPRACVKPDCCRAVKKGAKA